MAGTEAEGSTGVGTEDRETKAQSWTEAGGIEAEGEPETKEGTGGKGGLGTVDAELGQD